MVGLLIGFVATSMSSASAGFVAGAWWCAASRGLASGPQAKRPDRQQGELTSILIESLDVAPGASPVPRTVLVEREQ
jgi:hypothetical protein